MLGKKQDPELIYADVQPGAEPPKKDPARKRWVWALALVQAAALLVLGAAFLNGIHVREQQARYEQAQDLMEEKEYDAAMAVLAVLGDYRNSQNLLAELQEYQAAYAAAEALVDQQRYEEAVTAFRILGDYADSRIQAQYHVTYRKATDLMAETAAGRTQLLNRILNARVQISDEGGYAAVLGYETAAVLLESLGDYADAPALVDQCYDSAGRVKLLYQNWDGALAYLDKMSPEAAEALRQACQQAQAAAEAEQ